MIQDPDREAGGPDELLEELAELIQVHQVLNGIFVIHQE